MNKNDIKLIIVILIIIIILLITKKEIKGTTASVYYEDKLIKEIDLTKDATYSVNGYNGQIILEVKQNKIKVLEETSKNHICSKQGYSNLIICLPNKIIIKVNNIEEELDGVSK